MDLQRTEAASEDESRSVVNRSDGDTLKWPWPSPSSALPKAVREMGAGQTRLWQRLQYSERGWMLGKSVLLARRGRNHGLWTQDGTPTVPDHTRDLETRSGIVSSPQPYV